MTYSCRVGWVGGRGSDEKQRKKMFTNGGMEEEKGSCSDKLNAACFRNTSGRRRVQRKNDGILNDRRVGMDRTRKKRREGDDRRGKG